MGWGFLLGPEFQHVKLLSVFQRISLTNSSAVSNISVSTETSSAPRPTVSSLVVFTLTVLAVAQMLTDL